MTHVEQQNGSQLLVVGQLTFDTVPELYEAGRRLIASMSEICVELGGVTETDSSGLALLTSWLKLARASKKHIVFENIPTKIRNLSRVAGLDSVLPCRSK